jgi:hypothetical protein
VAHAPIEGQNHGSVVAIHPLSEIPDDVRYAQFLEQRAVLVNSKIQEERDLIRKILTLSSSGIAIYVSIILSLSGKNVSNIYSNIGFALLIITVIFSVVELYISSRAYGSQIEVLRKYYYLESENTQTKITRIVDILIIASLFFFVLAVVFLAVSVIFSSIAKGLFCEQKIVSFTGAASSNA